MENLKRLHCAACGSKVNIIGVANLDEYLVYYESSGVDFQEEVRYMMSLGSYDCDEYLEGKRSLEDKASVENVMLVAYEEDEDEDCYNFKLLPFCNNACMNTNEATAAVIDAMKPLMESQIRFAYWGENEFEHLRSISTNIYDLISRCAYDFIDQSGPDYAIIDVSETMDDVVPFEMTLDDVCKFFDLKIEKSGDASTDAEVGIVATALGYLGL